MIMKWMLRTAMAASLMATGANAANVEFRGGLCLTAANAACNAAGWDSGECFQMRFAPPNIADNGPQTKLSIFGGTFSLGFELQSGSLIGTTFKQVDVTKVARGGGTFQSQMRFTSQSPAAPTATTNFINMIGNIGNWDDVTGCTVGFRAAVTRRP